METPVLALVAVSCLVAAVVWGQSARRLRKVYRRVSQAYGPDETATTLARASYRKELHTAVLYGVLAAIGTVLAGANRWSATTVLAFVLVPVLVTVVWGREFADDSRLAEDRYSLERKAEEVLSQDELAPQRWAERLAPEVLPELDGFEIGKVYKAGAGFMAGDFYDVFRIAPNRIAAVIGDVTGHGIEPSITALQAKYLLRVVLRQFRDPAQAVEQLNAQLSALERGEEFISLVVVIFDVEAGTIRYASAGHPTAFLWHERDVHPLKATGPLLMLDPTGTYISREFSLDPGDLVLIYTDGLAEARDGNQWFGEERIANVLRRDPGTDPDVLCKSLLEAAKDFASSPLNDDVAIVAVRRA